MTDAEWGKASGIVSQSILVEIRSAEKLTRRYRPVRIMTNLKN